MDLMGWFLGDGRTDDADDAGDDDPFGGSDDEFDGLDGIDGFGEDGFGDDDPFETGGDDAADTAELESRIDEFEEEVASLSSTVNTVRSENEEISATVREVEENVRKLLDIYEMVTRGVNPFVDEAGVGAGGFDSGGFDLFDAEDDLNDGVAGADAEAFFDDDFIDPDEGGASFDDGPAGAGLDDAGGDSFAAAADGSDDDGKSFSELKEEYENGDPDRADEEPGGEAAVGADGGVAAADAGADESIVGPDDALDGAVVDELDDADRETDEVLVGTPPAAPGEGTDVDDSFGGGSEADGDALDDAGDAAVEESTAAADGPEDPVDADRTTGAARGEKPYLTALPGGYTSDLLVMEWLEYLVEAADVADAARAIRYYETIDWIDETVADDLEDYLAGFGSPRGRDDQDATPSELTMDHHTESLRYVSQLASTDPETMAFERLRGG